jgi:hypothetical protein
MPYGEYSQRVGFGAKPQDVSFGTDRNYALIYSSPTPLFTKNPKIA